LSALTRDVIFLALAVFTVSCGVYVVTVRNVVHAGFGLFPFFIGIAGIFATLSAHFFVFVQVLIYAGAILVLILFALMLTRDVMNPRTPQTNRMAWHAALLCVAATIGAVLMLTSHAWPVQDVLTAGTGDPARALATGAQQARVLGEGLIGLYALPFEVASLLLLAALIGAVVLAKSDREPPRDLPPLAVVESRPEHEPTEVPG